MHIRPTALCLGLAVGPGLAYAAHAAEYDVTVLQDPGGIGQSGTEAINASGQSVGYSKTVNGYDAVLWSPSGTATVLQNVSGQLQQRNPRPQRLRAEHRRKWQ